MERSRQLDKDFEYYLHKAAHLNDRVGDRLFQERAGITVMQYLLLQALQEKGEDPVSQQDLVVSLGTTKGAISRQIMNARQEGLLEVQVSRTSRRERATGPHAGGAAQ
jgi:DNA-binding MarR family transcriptional regulator